MIINRENKSIIGNGELDFHDATIQFINLDIDYCNLNVVVKDRNDVSHKLFFMKVFDCLFTRKRLESADHSNKIVGWFAIPNNDIQDNYLDEVRNAYVSNGWEWNENLFAVNIRISDMSDIKVICNEIITERLSPWK